MLSLTTTYSHIIDRLSGRRLGKDDIRTRLSFLDRLAGVCVGIVAAGLVGESFDSLVRSGWYESLNEYGKLSAIVGEIGGFAVTAGVVGEFILHWVLARAAERLDELTDLEVATLNRETALARVEIAEANERAAAASLETEKIRQKLAPRRLSEDQQQSIASKLAPFAGTRAGFILCTMNREVAVFAGDIAGALRIAGWDRISAVAIRENSVWTGVQVEIEGPGTDNPNVLAATALISVLRMEGIEVFPLPVPPQGGNLIGSTEAMGAPIRINIGEKP